MRDIRISIAIVISLLVFIGIIMIYSSSGVYAMQELGDSLYYLKRHLIFLVLACLITFLVMAVDYRDIRPYIKPLLGVSFIMLALVLIPGIGKASYGARRWFRLGPIHFQPSELVKLVMLFYVADFLARKQNVLNDFKQGFLPPMLVMGAVCLPILKQPDLGTTVLIVATTLVLLFIAGARMRYLSWLGLGILPAFYYLVYRVPYRWRRIVVFLDPWKDSQGAGFQLTQSQIALGSGGFFGVGAGMSVQKLFYLPAAHTDFIFSIIGEEWGFLGAFLVIVLFGCFIWQGARIAKRTLDPFGYYLACGIVTMIGLQAVVNIGVSIGALPTKGLPLPFVSYGGSALIFHMVAVGLLLNISRTEDL